MFDSGDETYHTSAPSPSGGWQYQGYFGEFLGTMIGPRHFITADHIGRQSTFVSSATFNGSATVTYHVDSAYNDGQIDGMGIVVPGRTLPGTDFRVYQIQETFSTWAPLYSGLLELNQSVQIFGNSPVRGNAILNSSGNLVGWEPGTVGGGVARWANETVGFVDDDFLYTFFQEGAGNAMLGAGDSGGGLFVNDGGVWKLAGLNYGSVLGPWDTDADHSSFYSAGYIFNPNGLYYFNSQDSTWTQLGPLDSVYSVHSRVSTNVAGIQGLLVVVPEPGGAVFLVIGMGVATMRWRRG